MFQIITVSNPSKKSLSNSSAVCLISGGNIDSGRLSRTIQRGLGAMGRLVRFAVAVPDHRGGLEQLAKTIAEENAMLKSLVTEQMWVHSNVGTTWVRFDSNESTLSLLFVRMRRQDHLGRMTEDVFPSSLFGRMIITV